MSGKTYSQIYYRDNKDKLLAYVKEKTKCDCGTILARINMARHKRSDKHFNKLKHNKFLEECKNNGEKSDV